MPKRNRKDGVTPQKQAETPSCVITTEVRPRNVETPALLKGGEWESELLGT